ncbi:MAG: M56 family metallopeptidase [Bacteroidota bacterium]
MLVWVIFFLANCIKISAGLAGIHRLRTYRTYSADEWQTKLNYLSKNIGIYQSVRLLQSGWVKVPVAVGFFKPVILVPLGLLSNLPADQVETILLHELAHIRRRDYLVNILQRFTEAVFFFNPAILWISSLIRQEREACCDDIVVANTTHKGSYLEALVSFQEYSSGSQYAMGISSKKHYLLNRVKRMLTRENKKLDLMEKILLIIGVIVFSAFTFIPKKEAAAQQPVRSSTKRAEPKAEVILPAALPASTRPAATYKAAAHKETVKAVLPVVTRDTVPPVKEKEQSNFVYEDLDLQSISTSTNSDGKTKTSVTTVVDQAGKAYTVTRLNDKITTLVINGNTIPEMR